MIKKIAFFLIVPLVVSLIGCSSIEKPTYESQKIDTLNDSKEAPKSNNDSNFLIGQINKITDGDTISLNPSTINLDYVNDPEIIEEIRSHLGEELTVRFLAVDTPEITKGKNELYGQEAKELVEYVLQDQTVILELDPNALFDKYDRLLAHIFTSEGENVQMLLLGSGLARTAYLFDEYKYIDSYEKAEEHAKEEKLNVYSIDNYVTSNGFNMDILESGTLNISDIENMSVNDMLHLLDDVQNMTVNDLFNMVLE